MAELMVASSGQNAGQGPAQGVVARIDWAGFLPLYQMAGKRAFLAELEREVTRSLTRLRRTPRGAERV